MMRNFQKIKTISLIAIISVMAWGFCYGAVAALNQDELKGYLTKGAPFSFILIDVRSSEEITAVIGNPKCKPYNLAWPEQFQKEVLRIPKNQTVIVYCRSGRRAENAAAFLQTNGYKNVLNAGGFMTWTGPTIPLSEIKPITQLPEPSMRAKTKK
jgi:rhodanese-related sulfurtransferase